jgi:hypothetical protein
MIPNNQPSSLSLRPEGFTTPAPPRGAAPWPTTTQRLFFFFFTETMGAINSIAQLVSNKY